MSCRGSSSDRRRGHPSGGPGLNQLAQSASHRERSSVIYMRRPGLVATERAWQGSALTERSNSMDEDGTNSSSPASPIWLICVVPAVAAHVDSHVIPGPAFTNYVIVNTAQAQRAPYITYSVIVPSALPRARTTRQVEPSSPPGAAGPHAAALHRSAAARGVPRASRDPRWPGAAR